MKETIRSVKSLDAMKYSDRMKPFTFTDEGFDSEADFVPYSDVTKVEKLWAPSGERNGMIRFRVKDRASTRSCDLFYPLEDASRVEQIIPFILSHSDSRFADNTSAQGCPVERPEIKGREQLQEKKGTRDEEDDDLRLPGIGYNFTSRDIPKLQELGDRARRGLR